MYVTKSKLARLRLPLGTEKYEAVSAKQICWPHIDRLNHDPKIDGILVQLPLPAHINANKVIEAIAAEKDVDGFHISNAGLLMTGQPLFRPLYTVWRHEDVGIDRLPSTWRKCRRGWCFKYRRQTASDVVLLQAGATVTICNSKTRDLGAHTRNADILVVATGKRNIVTADMVKPGAVVLDVGMNRDDEGKLCGDVDYANVKEVAGYITPVPGGVGPMTITMLLVNTIEAAERK